MGRALPPLSPQPTNPADQELSPDTLPPDMTEVREQLTRVAAQTTPLLLMGEPGTGKTRLAWLLHELSPRRAEPFLLFHAATLGEGLLEGVLFGYAQGAFPGAHRDCLGMLTAAGRGTLVVDQVDALPVALRDKLLQAAASQSFSPLGSQKPQPFLARLIVARNTPAKPDTPAGRLQVDQNGQPNVATVSLPPLRGRELVVGQLVQKFLAEFAAQARPAVRGIAAAARRALVTYRWPGNIRQLRNVIQRAVAHCNGAEVRLTDLPEVVRDGGG